MKHMFIWYLNVFIIKKEKKWRVNQTRFLKKKKLFCWFSVFPYFYRCEFECMCLFMCVCVCLNVSCVFDWVGVEFRVSCTSIVVVALFYVYFVCSNQCLCVLFIFVLAFSIILLSTSHDFRLIECLCVCECVRLCNI